MSTEHAENVMEFTDLIHSVLARGKKEKEEIDYFSAHIDKYLKDPYVFEWAVSQLFVRFPNGSVREAAAIIVARSELQKILPDMRAPLFEVMTRDPSPFVRWWIAGVLYRLGNRHPAVLAGVEEACTQSCLAGEFVRSLLPKKS